MWIFDAHLDLAMNAMEWNRDLTEPISTLRTREMGLDDKNGRGQGTVSLPEMRRGRVGLCVATQIARYVKQGNRLSGWHSPEQAWAQTQGQLAWYHAMEEAGELVQITDLESLNRHVDLWETNPPDDAPIGYLRSLEGADSIISPAWLEKSHTQGLRALGLSHYGPGTYAQGTGAVGGLGPLGRELLAEMERMNMILDVTHLCDESFSEVLDVFGGPVWASHNNCRALVPNDRQFSDEQILRLIERGAVIGAALDAWMMVPNWKRGETTSELTGVKLEHLIDHMDHICQLAGNARHIGIGSDLDGGFGREQSPGNLDTIADLQKLPDLLSARGYSDDEIVGVMHGNFLRFLRKVW